MPNLIDKAIHRTGTELIELADDTGKDLKLLCEEALGRIEILRSKIVDFMRKEEGL